jgi:two-component system chemotaxis sensor kinase CheA
MDDSATPTEGRTVRVLVVDDSRVIRRFVHAGLTKQGWAVETAEGGHEALAKILTFAPDVVVSDLNMPEMDGSEVVARVVALDPHLPVVMHSDEAELTRVLRTVNLGAFDFIPKSKDLGPLIAAVRRAAQHRWLKRDNERLTTELRELNQALERRVVERNAELHAVNRDMRLVLDQVDQGIATLNRDGTLSPQRSAVLDRWLGTYRVDRPLHDYIAELTNAELAAWFQVTWSSLCDADLPLELALEQMPKRLETGGRTFALAFKPILIDGDWDKMLFIMTDITADLERERAQRAQQDQLRAFEQITRDRKAFLEFFTEANAMVERLANHSVTGMPEVRRLVHTLKGNCAQAGVSGVALFCHDLETKMEEADEPLSAAQRGALVDLWVPFARSVEVVAGRAATRDVVEVPADELRVAIDLLLHGAESRTALDRMRAWEFEPVDRQLRRIGEQARALANRLGKGDLELDIEHNDVRLSPKAWSQFWSSVTHVVRNAIDHGIEPSEERVAAGKPAHGRLRLAIRARGAELTIQISDDGRGIDWDRVRERARSMGLPYQTADDLHEALFHGGLSTKSAVSEISGRGVGMSAIRAVCRRMGGELTVDSTWGHGTTISCTWRETTDAEVFRVSRSPSTLPASTAIC